MGISIHVRSTIPGPRPGIVHARPSGSSADWWKGQLELASNRNPGMRWALCVVEDDKDAKGIRTFQGGIVARAA